MKRQLVKNKIREFQPNFIVKIRGFINSDQFDKAESSIKRALRLNLPNNNFKSTLYALLGEINYLKGNIRSTKRYYNISLEINPNNELALYNYANFYLYEQLPGKAIIYIKKNLKLYPKKIKYIHQFVWYLVMAGEFKQAERFYKKLIESNKLAPQSFVDISMTYLSRGEFEKAKQIIFAALGKFPENFIVEDAMMELDEIEYNYHKFRKEIYFKRLHELKNVSPIYTAGLRKLVESMSIRGYFKFEIEKSADLLIELSKIDFKFPNSNVLAALCEIIISEYVGDYPQIFQNIANFYGTTTYMLRKCYNNIKEEYSEMIESVVASLIFVYNEEFDMIMNEFDEGDDE